MSNVVNGIDMAALLKSLKEETKKHRKENPKAYHAEYVKGWRKEKKVEMEKDPDYAAEKTRIEEERRIRRESILVKLQARRDKKEARAKSRLEHEEKKKEKKKEFTNLRKECLELSDLKEEEYSKINKCYLINRFITADVFSHYKVVISYFEDKKKCTRAFSTNPNLNLSHTEQAKIIIVSFMNRLNEPLEEVEEEMSIRFFSDDISKELEADFENFDLDEVF